MYPEQPQLINQVQRSNLYEEDKAFVVAAIQSYYKTLQQHKAVQPKDQKAKDEAKDKEEKALIKAANAADAKAKAEAEAAEETKRAEAQLAKEAEAKVAAEAKAKELEELRKTCTEMEITFDEAETIEQLKVKIEDSQSESEETTEDGTAAETTEPEVKQKTLAQMNKTELLEVCADMEVDFGEADTNAQLRTKIEEKVKATPAEQEPVEETPAK